MTNNTLNTKTNAEWAKRVLEYRATGSELLFIELLEDLKKVAIPLGRRSYYTNIELGTSIHDFEYEAEYAIYKALEVYDPEKGSLPALLKQLVIWGISDHILRPARTHKGRLARSAVSINALNTGEENLGKLTIDALTVSEEEVYGEIFDPEKERTFVTILEELIEAFSESCSDDDRNIIKTVFNVVLNEGEFSAKNVNNSLSEIFPEIKIATIRKKKQRALDRFTAFAKNKGYESINLSQF